MTPVIIHLTETRQLKFSAENNLFIIVSTVAAEDHEHQLTTKEAHQLLEAVSQFLAETP